MDGMGGGGEGVRVRAWMVRLFVAGRWDGPWCCETGRREFVVDKLEAVQSREAGGRESGPHQDQRAAARLGGTDVGNRTRRWRPRVKRARWD